MKFVFFINAIHHWERIGLMTLVSILEDEGDVIILYNTNSKSEKDIYLDMEKLRPDVFAYSMMSTEAGRFLKLNKYLKNNISFSCKAVIGGPHPTFFPEVIEDPDIDAICRGEGEVPILKYRQYLKGEIGAKDVPNFIIKDNNFIVKNQIAIWPKDLDNIPFPKRRIWDKIDKNPSQKSFFSSRGCPYKCAYCFNHKYNEIYGYPKPLVRRRSVDNFILEIKEVMEMYPDIFPFFDDDSFLMAPLSWLIEFKEKYLKEINKPFGCNIRADQVSEEKIKTLAESRCYLCWFGLECGDEDFANNVMKRNLSNEKIEFTARMLRKYGIKYATQNINALPSDDPIETDLKTLELNIKCKPDFAMAHIFYPFPRTELGKYAFEKNLFDNDFEKLNDPLCEFSPLSFDSKLKNKIERLNRLFPIIVGFPFLKPILPFLIKLPLGKFYFILSLIYGGYCIRVKLTPAKKNLKYYFSLISLFLKKLFK